MSKRSLPTVVSSIPRDLRTFIDRLRDMLTDGSADRIITARELANAGVVSILGNGALALPEGSSLVQSPPAPTNVAATGAVANIFVEWDAPIYRGHAYAEIWSSPTDDLGAAVLVGMAPGSLFLDAVGFSTTRYYWVRFVNALDEKGSYNGISGTSATTAVDVDYLLGVLEGEITESQLYTDLSTKINDSADGVSYLATQNGIRVQASSDGKTVIGGFGVMGSVDAEKGPTIDFGVLANSFYIAAPATATGVESAIPFVVQTTATTINGVEVPIGVYMRDAFIQNGTITNAKIANLAVDDAKIASLSVGKLKAGSIAVGEYIESTGYVAGSAGWRIDGNGNAELSNATVRGAVYATSGQFWGTLLGGAASDYSTGLGFYAGGGTTTDGAGYRWRVGSPSGARIQWTGSSIEVYNASNQLTLSSGGADWASVTGTGKPADGATVGAAFGVNISGQITSSNVSTYIAGAAIGTAQIFDAAITQAKIGNAAVGSAQIADAAITNAKIGTAAVDTLQLAGQAVTLPISAYTAGPIGLTTSYIAVQSASITLSENFPIVILFSFLNSSTNYAKVVQVRISRDATVVFESNNFQIPSTYADYYLPPVSFNIADSPGAGSFTYKVEVRHALYAFNITHRSLTLIGFKR